MGKLKLSKLIEKMKTERRKITKAIVPQEKVFEKSSELLIDLTEKRWENSRNNGKIIISMEGSVHNSTSGSRHSGRSREDRFRAS